MSLNLSPEGHELWRNLLKASPNAAALLNTLILEADDMGRGETTLQRLSGKMARKPEDILTELMLLQRMDLVWVRSEPLKTQKVVYALTTKTEMMVSKKDVVGRPGR